MGARTITDKEFEFWPEVVAALGASDTTEWIFRGQPDLRAQNREQEYELRTKLERTLSAAGFDRSTWPDRETAAIAFFKERTRAVLPKVPHEDDVLGWLTLMQHYGAPTRLLDWTASPFVACYFAYANPWRDPNGTSADGALWMLNAHLCRGMFGTLMGSGSGRDHVGVRAECSKDLSGKETKSYPGVDLDWHAEENRLLRHAIEHKVWWPLPLRAFAPDQRMIAQQAVFTCDGSLSAPVDHLRRKDEWRMPGCAPGRWSDGLEIPRMEERAPAELIFKVRLPWHWRDQALRTLEKMNINAATLFPGLDGIGMATALHVQVGGLNVHQILER